MTISSTDDPRAGPFNGNGSQTAFPFEFKTFAEEDLLVVRTDEDGLETILVLDSDYSVALNADQNADPGGTVTYPVSGDELPAGETLTIASNLDYTQETDITNGGGFYPQVIEDALDRSVMLVKQVNEKVDRALRLAVSTDDSVDVTLPAPVADKIIGWNDTATGLVNRDITDFATVVAFAAWQSQTFDGDGVTTQFTLSSDPGNINNLDIAISGVTQVPLIDFTLSGVTLTFLSAPPAGTDNVFARWGQALPQGTATADQVSFDVTQTYDIGTIGAATKDGRLNLMWFVEDAAERAAILNYTSTTDHTTIINTALGYGKRLYAPAGRWNVDTDVGVVLASGFNIVGDGFRTMFVALPNGATTAELVAYTKGSMFKRAFTPGVANDYVMGGYLADFSVILNPQTPYNAANYKQIGVDLRNITRSVVERLYVANITDAQTHPWAIIPAVALSAADQTQNYGIVLGTRSGAPDYCGGERNTIRDSLVWCLYKNIAIDDPTLSPLSSAHQTTVDTCDLQGGHELLTQGSQYNAGTVIRNVTVQANRRQTGNADPTIGVAVAGYNCAAEISYAEMGAACDQILTFTSTARRCRGSAIYYAYTSPSTGLIADNGTGGKNLLDYPAPVTTGSDTIGEGELTELFNKGYRKVYAKFHWSGAAIVIDESVGVASVTRNGVGDYTVVLSRAMPSAHWAANVTLDTNASGHGGTVSVLQGSQSTTNFRFVTLAQNGGTSTQIDPRFVYFIGTQV
jgi:hypothetical protein